MRRSSLSVVLFALAIGPAVSIVACGDDTPQPKSPSDLASATPTTTSSDPGPGMATSVPEPPTAASSAPPPPKPPPPTIEDVTAAADPKPLPSIKLTGIANEASLDPAKAKDTELKLDLKNWELGKDGQHVHVILDGMPYKKVMDAKAPLKLGDLLAAGTELTEGQHYLVAFASRGTHESVKGKGSSSFLTFWVGKKGKTPTYDGKKPLLVYSRPKGDNFGGMGKALMIDFYLHETTLEKGEKVRFTVSSDKLDAPVTGEFTKWAPKLVKGLPAGNYEVKLELLDKEGKVSDLAWNTTTRKIVVDADKPMDPAMGMSMDMPMPK